MLLNFLGLRILLVVLPVEVESVLDRASVQLQIADQKAKKLRQCLAISRPVLVCTSMLYMLHISACRSFRISVGILLQHQRIHLFFKFRRKK